VFNVDSKAECDQLVRVFTSKFCVGDASVEAGEASATHYCY